MDDRPTEKILYEYDHKGDLGTRLTVHVYALRLKHDPHWWCWRPIRPHPSTVPSAPTRTAVAERALARQCRGPPDPPSPPVHQTSPKQLSSCAGCTGPTWRPARSACACANTQFHQPKPTQRSAGATCSGSWHGTQLFAHACNASLRDEHRGPGSEPTEPARFCEQLASPETGLLATSCSAEQLAAAASECVRCLPPSRTGGGRAAPPPTASAGGGARGRAGRFHGTGTTP